jgi:hypothetical protein
MSSYDAWKTTPPDYGGGEANPTKAFWDGFRFAQRTGSASAYLDLYRHTKRFGALVTQAEPLLAHHAGCDCQTCMKVGA